MNIEFGLFKFIKIFSAAVVVNILLDKEFTAVYN